MSLPPDGSVGQVTERVLRFVRNQGRGFARSSFRSEFARQAVLERLRGHGLACFDQTLLANDDPPDVAARVDDWVRGIESHEGPLDVISLVLTASPGASRAFQRACGRLNLYRETIGDWQATFLLWLPVSWLTVFANAIPDFDSWIMLRLELMDEALPPDIALPGVRPSAIKLLPEEARRLSQRNLARAEGTAGSQSLAFAAAAVQSLRNAGLPGEAHETALRLLPRYSALELDAVPDLRHRANLFKSALQLSAAQSDLENALSLLRANVPAAELDSADVSSDLADVLESQGHYAQAEPLYARSFAVRERVLGAEHPQTLSSVNNLAGLYERQGRYVEAEPLYERALAARERVLGAEHPQTLSSVNNLAYLYARQGRYDKAEPLYARALSGAEKVLGPDHPNTRIVRENLARLRSLL